MNLVPSGSVLVPFPLYLLLNPSVEISSSKTPAQNWRRKVNRKKGKATYHLHETPILHHTWIYQNTPFFHVRGVVLSPNSQRIWFLQVKSSLNLAVTFWVRKWKVDEINVKRTSKPMKQPIYPVTNVLVALGPHIGTLAIRDIVLNVF